jgi:lysophospholipase L1-like esterase
MVAFDLVATVIWKGRSMSRKETVLWILMGLGVVSVADGVQAVDPDPNRFAKEIEAFEQWDAKNAFPANPILFVGSSSIRMWRTHEAFPDLPVTNRGFGGSHISDVLHFFDRVVLLYQPKVIVFYAGDNDIAAGKSAQRVLGDYGKFVNLVHDKLPKARLIFVTIKASGRRWSLWSEMRKANDLVRDFCEKDDRLFFADLATPLLDSKGKPDDGFFLDDRLHLNVRGYAVWNKTLAPILERAIASSSAGANDR